MRFSHREYVGSQRSRAVLRCSRCGGTVHGEARENQRKSDAGGGSRKPPVNQGPPSNTVLDADTAERLRQLLGDSPDA